MESPKLYLSIRFRSLFVSIHFATPVANAHILSAKYLKSICMYASKYSFAKYLSCD